MLQIPNYLDVHPEVGRVSKKLCQPQCSTWRDTTSSIDDVIDALIRYMNGICQVTLCQVRRNQEFFQEYFSRMGGDAIGGYSNHDDLSLG